MNVEPVRYKSRVLDVQMNKPTHLLVGLFPGMFGIRLTATDAELV